MVKNRGDIEKVDKEGLSSFLLVGGWSGVARGFLGGGVSLLQSSNRKAYSSPTQDLV